MAKFLSRGKQMVEMCRNQSGPKFKEVQPSASKEISKNNSGHLQLGDHNPNKEFECLIENASIVFEDDVPSLDLLPIDQSTEHIAGPLRNVEALLETEELQEFSVTEPEHQNKLPENEDGLFRIQDITASLDNDESMKYMTVQGEPQSEDGRFSGKEEEEKRVNENPGEGVVEEETSEEACNSQEMNTLADDYRSDHGPDDSEPDQNLLESDSNSETIHKSSNKRKHDKLLRMQGKSYVGFRRPRNQNQTFQDTRREERQLGERCASKRCKKFPKRNCDDTSEDIRERIFTSFWKNLNWNERKVYVSNLVTKQETFRKTKEDSRRNVSLYYYSNVGDRKIPVCKKMFLNTLGLREWCVRSWINSADFGTTKQRNSARRDLGHQKPITDFLEALPKLPSHYCRKDSKKLYLEQDFKSYSDLYKAYTLYTKEIDGKVSCRTTFMNLVRELNIAIFKPRKDMCDICVEYESGNLSKTDWEEHIKKKERAHEEKRKDKERAERKQCYVLTMDLQAVKTCPAKQASSLYSKTKLCCHNFTLYDLATKEVTCYWFDETDTDLQASTFATMLVDFIKRKKYYNDNSKPLIIYSDGCTYQNRNAVLANSLLSVSYQYNMTIIQKFLVKGQSQMKCDSVHATIEKKLRNKDIKIPNEFHKARIDARQKPFPYEVVSPKYNFFINFNTDLVYESIRTGKKTNDPTVTQIRALRYEKGVIFYSLDFDHEFKELPHRPKGET